MTPPQDAESYILFELGGTTYGVRSREVLHIEMLDHITPVPNAPPFVDGVVFSRGQVIAAINLRTRFGFPRDAYTLRTRLLVVQAGSRAVGLIADSAREFRTVPLETIHAPEAASSGLSGRFLSGIATIENRLVLLLNVGAVVEAVESQAPAETLPVGTSETL